jgi:hypothetical protein
METRITQWIGFGLVLSILSIATYAEARDSRPTYCTHGGTVRTATVASQMNAAEMIPAPQLLPVSGYPELEVRVLETYRYTVRQKEKLDRIIPLMKQALNSEALRNFILNHTYRGKKQFSDNEGLTNEQIYDKMRDATEELFQNDKYVAEFRSELYYTRRNTVGYVTPSWPDWIMTNTKFYNPWPEEDVAGHLAHEWLHLIGFSHYQTFDYSVPYAVGDEVARIAASFR